MAKVRKNIKGLRFFIGDIRDRDRIRRAMNGIDIVIHSCFEENTNKYNPTEFIKTNILGAENIIEASLDTRRKKL